MPPGQRSVDYDDYPKEKSAYAMRNCQYYIQQAQQMGTYCGRFTQHLLSGDYPWSKLRQAQKLISLGKKYGCQRVENACKRAVEFSVFNIYRVEHIIKEAACSLPLLDEQSSDEQHTDPLPGRFRRKPDYFKHPIHGETK